MMDCCCYPDEESLLLVQDALSRYPGAILNSGGSFHYYGGLADEIGWDKFMNLCIEYPDLFDRHFIEASLARGACVLRVYAYPPDKEIEPYVIATIPQKNLLSDSLV